MDSFYIHSSIKTKRKKQYFRITGDDSDNVSISGPVVFEQYIVIADYQKKNRNDISLTAGDTVDVVERNELGENATNTINNF